MKVPVLGYFVIKLKRYIKAYLIFVGSVLLLRLLTQLVLLAYQ
jgi:hypothetical protein